MTSFKYNRVSIPPKRFRFGLSDAGSVIHIYKERLSFSIVFTRIEYNRVSIPLKRLDSGCQVMVIMIHLKNTRNLFLVFTFG